MRMRPMQGCDLRAILPSMSETHNLILVLLFNRGLDCSRSGSLSWKKEVSLSSKVSGLALPTSVVAMYEEKMPRDVALRTAPHCVVLA